MGGGRGSKHLAEDGWAAEGSVWELRHDISGRVGPSGAENWADKGPPESGRLPELTKMNKDKGIIL